MIETILTNNMKKQTLRLIVLMSLGALTGPVAIASLSGLFRIENSFMIAFGFIAGPGSIVSSILLDGTIKERIFTAVLAGIISTVLIALAAGFGPELLNHLNVSILKISGGVAVLIIGLIIIGINIPEKVPLAIMILGLILGGLIR
jgi:hypothetical protein